MSIARDRALALLGSGLGPEIVATSLGVTTSAISQWLSEEEFAAAVAELRFKNLAQHNERDAGYDAIEDQLLDRLKDCLPLMHRPMEILKAIQIINAAKRRGQSTPESIIQKQAIIQLTIPVQVINQFKANAQGQVTSIGIGAEEKTMLTIQSGQLNTLTNGGKNDGAAKLPRVTSASSSRDRREEETITCSQ